MMAPWPQLVAVTDTNALASRAANAARGGTAESLFTGLARTGRSHTYIGAHVPGELTRHLPAIAASARADYRVTDRVLRTEILPNVFVVDLAIRDYLHPRIRTLLNVDRELPKSMRGDPDDIATPALAELLAPAVILSSDSVFTRLGMSNTTATAWLEAAYNFLHAAGFEATFTDAAILVELAGRAIIAIGGGLIRLASSHPVPFFMILSGALYLAIRAGWLDAARLRSGIREVWQHAAPLLQALAEASQEHLTARSGLHVIEPYAHPTVDESAARYLARCGRPLDPSDLRDALGDTGFRTSAAQLRRAMNAHPAFVRLPGDIYTIGTPTKLNTPIEA
jgi:hypothetical protein